MRGFKVESLAAVLLVSAGAFAGACGGENATNSPAVTPSASAAPPPASSAATSAPPPSASAPAPAESAASAPATASPEDEEVSADLSEYHGHHHHGGVMMFIAMSLDSLGVAPDQAAKIEKIQSDLFAKMEPAHAAEQKVLTILADGVAAGKIDDAKVKGAIDAVKTASLGVQDAAVQSLNELHAALTPEQRAALADKVEAHWEVWKNSNNQEEAVGDEAHPGHLDLVAKDLNLTPNQVTQVRATFSETVKKHPLKFDASQVETHIQEFGTAFRSDKFDAKALKHGPFAHEHLAVWGAWRMAHFYEAVGPALTPEQRAKLSTEMKEHAAAKSGIFDGDKHER
ncbi:MAG: Spy/CpxP family protein refolding chaperone [Polyangiaceae bacterium]